MKKFIVMLAWLVTTIEGWFLIVIFAGALTLFATSMTWE